MRPLPRLSLAVLLGSVGIILWGAFLRAIGPGAECRGHWPLCDGEALADSSGLVPGAELTHHVASGLVLLLALALVVMAHRCLPSGNPARWGSVLAVGFLATETLLGSGLFPGIDGIDAIEDRGLASAAVLVSHHLNSFLLLAAATLTTLWAHDQPPLDLRRSKSTTRWIVVAWVGMASVGATGAIAALGNTLFETTGGGESILQDLSSSGVWLLRLRELHPAIAVFVGLVLIRLPRWIRETEAGSNGNTARRQAHSRRYANGLAVAVLLQLAIGALNIFLLVPTWLQLTHLALAQGVWILLVLYSHSVLAERP